MGGIKLKAKNSDDQHISVSPFLCTHLDIHGIQIITALHVHKASSSSINHFVIYLTCRKTYCMTVNKYVFLVHNNKTYFNMPMFPKRSNHTFLNRSSTSTTNGNTHLIMTAQTIQLILGGKKICIYL